jgi:HEAT repeat protein
MEALGAIGPDAEAAVPGLVRLAQEPYDRGIALDNLQKIGCRSKEILVGLLESPSRSLRAFAVENLGKLGPDAADAAPALRKLLEDEQDQRVRRGARAALERIRAPD